MGSVVPYRDNFFAALNSAVFSDGLSFEKARELLEKFGKEIKVSFGIGTNLTNDIPNFTAANIVIKMTRCNDLPVAKISDSPKKTMCPDKKFFN